MILLPVLSKGLRMCVPAIFPLIPLKVWVSLKPWRDKMTDGQMQPMCVLSRQNKKGGAWYGCIPEVFFCVCWVFVFHYNFSFSWFDSFFSTRFLKSLPGPVLTSDWSWRTTASCWNPLAAMPGIKIVPVSLCFEPSQLSVTHGTSCSIQNPQRTNGVTVWGLLPGERRYFLFPVRATAFLRGSFAQEMAT